MITQETKPVKTWGGFNLTILKVNLNPLSWKNRSSYNKTYKPPRSTSYCYSRTYWHDHVQAPNPRIPSFLDSPPNTSTPSCVFFKLQWQQLEWSSRCRKFFSLKTLSLCEGSSLKISQEIHINRDMSNIDFREVWVQNPKTKRGTRGTLISLSSV